jgi:drug/metabolite transporter (DMT)-like permease
VPVRARTWSRSLNATALLLIFVAAIAHASWNLFSKQASVSGAASFVWLMSATATVAYLPVVAASVIASPPHLSALAWVFMAGTGLLQVGYFLFLQTSYRLGDLSLIYPIGRGTGALLAALGGIILLGERPGPAGIAGILLIVGGLVILGIPASGGPGLATEAPRTVAATTGAVPTNTAATKPVTSTAATSTAATSTAATSTAATSTAASTGAATETAAAVTAKAVMFALITGLFIATYTLWDKYAVSTLNVPPLVQGYASLPVMALIIAPFALLDRGRTARVWITYRRQVLGAAVLSPLAYILVLVALSFTAVSAVAPTREVSVLLGVLLGRRLLGEGSLARRLTAAATIAAGIICIAVG